MIASWCLQTWQHQCQLKVRWLFLMLLALWVAMSAARQILTMGAPVVDESAIRLALVRFVKKSRVPNA